jgi:hypothetical protein
MLETDFSGRLVPDTVAANSGMLFLSRSYILVALNPYVAAFPHPFHKITHIAVG